MIWRRKRQPPARTPNISRPQQPIFQYSSNRSPAERTRREGFDGIASQAVGGRTARKLSISLVAIFLVLASVFASTLTATPTVVVDDGGQPLRNPADYAETAEAAARRKLRGYSKFTLDRQHIAVDLRSKYPEVVAVDVGTPLLGRSAVIYISQSKPAVILSEDDSKFALDSEGLAILEVGRSSSFRPKGLVEIRDETGTDIRLGHPALTSVQIAFIAELKRQSEAKKIPLNSAILTGGGGELNVKHGNSKYFVKYNLYENARKSFGTFAAIKEYLEDDKKEPAEYIDVRIPERAYVK